MRNRSTLEYKRSRFDSLPIRGILINLYIAVILWILVRVSAALKHIPKGIILSQS